MTIMNKQQFALLLLCNSLGWMIKESNETVLTKAGGTTVQLQPRSTSNRDARYDIWSNPQRILYRLDASYNVTQAAAITDAMNQVSQDMSSCIHFTPYNRVTDSREDHLVVSQNFNSGTAATTCTTFPGRLIRQNAAGQKMLILPGTGGCMSSKRDLMAIIVPVLGLRNEYKRPDREQFLRTFPNNILNQFQSLNLLKMYDSTQVEYASTPFDFFSVTMPIPTRFAKPMTVVFTPRTAGQKLGNLARLSSGDCQGLKKLYPSCSTVTCSDPYAGLLSASDNTIAAAATTTRAPVASSVQVASVGTIDLATGAVVAVSNVALTTAAPINVDVANVSNAVVDSTGPLPIDPPLSGFSTLDFWLDPANKKP